jgi:toxin ParE1/3/4
MSAAVFRTKAALSDLNQLAAFIQRDSPDAAIRFLAAAERTFQRLAGMPELGERQEFGRRELAGLRMWHVEGFDNYVIFYRPAEGGIDVLRVLHAARDTAAVFGDPA